MKLSFLRTAFTVCKNTVAVLCIVSDWISPGELSADAYYMNLLYTSLEHFVMPSLKFILRIFRKSGERIRVLLNLTKVKGVLHEDLGTFLIIYL